MIDDFAMVYSAQLKRLTIDISVADPGEGPITQNDWTSLIIHDRRSGKFECTSALNKLPKREEWAIFGPPALIKLLGATSLVPK